MEHTPHTWTIFSNHGMVLFHIAAAPNSTLRQLALRLGITERQVATIVKDLAAAGMLKIERHGRRNSYSINPDAHLRHPTLAHIPLRRIIAAVVPEIQQGPPLAADETG